MKHLFIFLFLLPVLSVAQKKTYTLADMPFERDSLTGGMVYRGVVEVPGATQDQLYTRAKSFMLKAFTNNTAVIQVDDKAAGLIGGKGQRAIQMSTMLLAMNNLQQIYYEVPFEIRVKDGKYRYEMSNIVLINRGMRIDIDKEFKKRPHTYDKMSESQYNRYTSKDPFNDLVNELKATMAKSDPKDF